MIKLLVYCRAEAQLQSSVAWSMFSNQLYVITVF